MPLIFTNTSSRCHLSPGRGRRQRSWLAEGLPELGTPAPDRLVADHDATCQHQLLDLTKAQREPQVQPDAVIDDLQRVAVALVRRRCGAHPRDLSRSPMLTNVTVPWELTATKPWSWDPNVRTGSADYRLDLAECETRIANYNGVGGGTNLFNSLQRGLAPADRGQR